MIKIEMKSIIAAIRVHTNNNLTFRHVRTRAEAKEAIEAIRDMEMNKFRIIVILVFSLLFACAQVDKKYYDSGKLMEKCNEEDCVEYYKNGSIKSTFKRNSYGRQGLVVEYDSIGRLASRIEYKNDMKDGSGEIFDYQDKIRKVRLFSNDTLNGEAINYDLEGRLISHGHFNKGMRKGFFSYYDGTGRLFEEIQYDIGNNGYFVNQYKHYSNSGLDSSKSYFYDLVVNEESGEIKVKIDPDFENMPEKSFLVLGDFGENVDDFIIRDTVYFKDNSFILSTEQHEKYNGGIAYSISSEKSKLIVSGIYIRLEK